MTNYFEIGYNSRVVMKIFSSIFFVFLCLFFGCQKKDTNLSTLKINTPGEPPTLDSRKASDNVSSTIIRACFEGLTRKTPNQDIELALAESYNLSEDGKTYTFNLKEAYWSNGQKITAYEFEETWKEILKPEFPAFTAFEFYKIKNAKKAKEGKLPIEDVGIQALDDKTLVITLEHPMGAFLELISTASFYVFPSWVAENNLAFYEDKSHPFICSGPFIIKDWKTQHHMIFEKNLHYWDKDSVKLDQIKMSFVQDQSTELSLYEQGELDWMGSPISNIPSDAINMVKSRDDFYTYKMSGVYFYLFNTTKFPLNNANIRKALTLAINRKSIIDHVIQIDLDSATSFVPTIVKSLNKNFFTDGDVLRAREFFKQGLEDLGIGENEFPVLELSFNTEPSSHFKIAQAIQQQWKKALGIKVVLKNTEWKVYLDDLTHKKFEIARMGSASSFADAGFFIEQFAYKDIGFNFAGWYNKNYENLYFESLGVADPEKRLSILNKAENIFMDEMPIAPIYFYSQSYLKKPYVKDIALSLTGSIDFKWAYIDRSQGSQ